MCLNVFYKIINFKEMKLFVLFHQNGVSEFPVHLQQRTVKSFLKGFIGVI